MTTARRFVAAASLLLTATTSARAQLPSSTGIDNSWHVAITGYQNDIFSAFVGATKVTNGPWWAWTGNTSSYAWISTNASATQAVRTGDGQPNYDYLFRTSFTLGANASDIGFIFRCAIDNSGGLMRVNGGQWQNAGCGVFDFGAAHTVAGFQTGSNTLEFIVSGDGSTDGLVVAMDQQITVTPEPASLILLGSGMAGVAAAARRRKRAGAKSGKVHLRCGVRDCHSRNAAVTRHADDPPFRRRDLVS